MEITPFCVFLLYSPPLSFPVFSVLSSPLLTCPILSCTPFSFLFPCLSPFLFFNVLLPVYSPFLPFSCTLLLSSPLLPFSLAHSFTPAKVNKSGAVSTLSLLETAHPSPQSDPVTKSDSRTQEPLVCPLLRQGMSSLSQGMKVTGKKKLLDSKTRGEVLCVLIHLWHIHSGNSFSLPLLLDHK